MAVQKTTGPLPHLSKTRTERSPARTPSSHPVRHRTQKRQVPSPTCQKHGQNMLAGTVDAETVDRLRRPSADTGLPAADSIRAQREYGLNMLAGTVDAETVDRLRRPSADTGLPAADRIRTAPGSEAVSDRQAGRRRQYSSAARIRTTRRQVGRGRLRRRRRCRGRLAGSHESGRRR